MVTGGRLTRVRTHPHPPVTSRGPETVADAQQLAGTAATSAPGRHGGEADTQPRWARMAEVLETEARELRTQMRAMDNAVQEANAAAQEAESRRAAAEAMAYSLRQSDEAHQAEVATWQREVRALRQALQEREERMEVMELNAQAGKVAQAKAESMERYIKDLPTIEEYEVKCQQADELQRECGACKRVVTSRTVMTSYWAWSPILCCPAILIVPGHLSTSCPPLPPRVLRFLGPLLLPPTPKGTCRSHHHGPYLTHTLSLRLPRALTHTLSPYPPIPLTPSPFLPHAPLPSASVEGVHAGVQTCCARPTRWARKSSRPSNAWPAVRRRRWLYCWRRWRSYDKRC